MSGGVLLLIAGIWVGSQVLAGNAIARLGIGSTTSGGPTTITTTDNGVSTNTIVPVTSGLGPGVIAPNATAGKAVPQ